MTEERFFTDNCFCCGKDNHNGLSVAIEKTEKGARIRTQIADHFRSFPGMAHGGIATTLVDEALWYAFYFKDIMTVTRKLEVMFKKHVPLETPIIIEAEVKEHVRANIWTGVGKITDENGRMLILAHGEFAEMKELKDKLFIRCNKS